MAPKLFAAVALTSALAGAAVDHVVRPFDPPPVVALAYAPAENLERADVALIDTARTSIDVAAYSLTSHSVADALDRAVARGVRVRILVEASQAGRNAAVQGAEIREWKPAALMHLKSFVVDGAVLREGSANFSPSGLKSQLNSRFEIRDPALVGRAAEMFEREWSRSSARRPN